MVYHTSRIAATSMSGVSWHSRRRRFILSNKCSSLLPRSKRLSSVSKTEQHLRTLYLIWRRHQFVCNVTIFSWNFQDRLIDRVQLNIRDAYLHKIWGVDRRWYKAQLVASQRADCFRPSYNVHALKTRCFGGLLSVLFCKELPWKLSPVRAAREIIDSVPLIVYFLFFVKL